MKIEEIKGVANRIESSDSFRFNHDGHFFRLDEVGCFLELWRIGVEIDGRNKLVCRIPRFMINAKYLSKILHLSCEIQLFGEQ